MANAPKSTRPPPPIQAVPSGVMESAPNALKDGSLMLKKSAHPFQIFAQAGMILVPAPNATTDIL